MKKKMIKKFTEQYAKLDKACSAKFGVVEGGFDEYLNRLHNLRYAPDRDELIPVMTRIQSAAHGEAADITKDDLKWMAQFEKSVTKKTDSLSRYLKEAHKYANKKKSKKVFGAIGAILVVALVAVAFYFANKYFGFVNLPF